LGVNEGGIVMKELLLGTFPKENNLYIQLQPNASNFVKPYDFIVLSCGERQIKISMEELSTKTPCPCLSPM
jgi:hypothetical protein